MKFTLVFAFVVLAAACILQVSSLPIDEEQLLEEPYGTQQERIRVKRFTCDVLSAEFGTVKVNHAACGVHCLFRGRTGGYCNGQRVCICR